MARGDHQTARLHREWLNSLPAIIGMQLTTLAKQAGVAPSTLTRPVKEGDLGTSTLNAMTIEKIVAYCLTQGVTVPWPQGNVAPPISAAPARHLHHGVPEEGTPFNSKAETALAAAVRAMIGAREDVIPVTLLTSAIDGLGYLPGDILIYDMRAMPRAGDVVRALVKDRNGNIEETVWRLYDPPYLVGMTRDPAHMPKPLTEVPSRVEIVGVAIGMIRPGQRDRAA